MGSDRGVCERQATAVNRERHSTRMSGPKNVCAPQKACYNSPSVGALAQLVEQRTLNP